MRGLVAAVRQRPGLVVGLVLAIALLTALLMILTRRSEGFVDGYRPVDARASELTLVVTGGVGERVCRVLVEEPANRIEVRVQMCGGRLGSGTDLGVRYLAVATLRSPVGDRVVVTGDGRVLDAVSW